MYPKFMLISLNSLSPCVRSDSSLKEGAFALSSTGGGELALDTIRILCYSGVKDTAYQGVTYGPPYTVNSVGGVFCFFTSPTTRG